MKRVFQILTMAAVLGLVGCVDSIVPGLRFAATEDQKQAAEAADDLAGRLSTTGTRPGSAAALALAKMTRPGTIYAGPPKEPIDLESLATIEAGQWRHKDDQVQAAQLRDNLRARTLEIVNTKLGELAELVSDKAATIGAAVDRMAAIATVATMAEDLAETIPDPRSPDETRSPEAERIAEAAAQAVASIAKVANDAATARPTGGEVVDKTIDQVDKTVGKVVQTGEKALAIYEKYAPEIIGLLSLAGIGAGGYAVKKRRDTTNANNRADRGSEKIAEALAKVAEVGGDIEAAADSIRQAARNGGNAEAAAEAIAAAASTGIAPGPRPTDDPTS
jgi:hypothetical protein